MNIHPYFLLVFPLCLLIACNQTPKHVQEVLAVAESNRTALEKVIEHYSRQGKQEKLKAVYFLIGNMAGKYAHDGEVVRSFDVIFDMMDSLHRNKIRIPVVSPVLKKIWDSLVNINGNPRIDQADLLYDYEEIKADFLIENIDLAFKAREASPWLRKLSFEQFCEYILPYRIGNERLEPWRRPLHEKFKLFRDTSRAENIFEYSAAFNLFLRSNIGINHTLGYYPFDMKVSQMEKARRGACKHLVYYEATAMRACGIPVGVDYTPLWGDHIRGHDWITLWLEDDRFYPFDAFDDKFRGLTNGYYPYRFAKVFRKTFAKQRIEQPSPEDVPEDLVDDYRKDVTATYTKTFDIAIPLPYAFSGKKQYALICTFNGKTWRDRIGEK